MRINWRHAKYGLLLALGLYLLARLLRVEPLPLLLLGTSLAVLMSMVMEGFDIPSRVFLAFGNKMYVVNRIFPREMKRSCRELRVLGVSGTYSRIPLAQRTPELLLYQYNQELIMQHCSYGNVKALVLGGGGGTIPDYLSKINRAATIDVVEISEEMVQAAKRYFVKENKQITFHVTDAEQFVTAAPASYDFIFCDIFVGDSIPNFVCTESFCQNLSALVNEDGILVVNLGRVFDKTSEAIDTYKAVFRKLSVLSFRESVILVITKGNRPIHSSYLVCHLE